MRIKVPLPAAPVPATREEAVGIVREITELLLEELLAARDNYDLKALGCQVVQVDEFYVEPKISKTEDRAKAA
jgi:hypothetical protein